MNAPAIPTLAARSTAGAPLLWLTIVVVGTAFFCTEHKLLVTKMEMYGTTAEDFEHSSTSTNLLHYFGFLLLAGLGTAFLFSKCDRKLCLTTAAAVMLILFLLWCFASVGWSIERGKTVRRLGVMSFCWIGALGIGKRLAARDLCIMAAAITASYAGLGLFMELVLGTFKITSSEYRFAGTLHPNSQGGICALCCLSTICLFKIWPQRKWLLLALLLFAAGLLVISKSRTSCVALGLGLFAIWALRAPLQVQLWTVFTALFTVSLVMLVVLVGGDEVADRVTEAVLLGRKEHAGTLTGRTELWEELITYYIAKSPWLGYGYTAFWSVRNINDISETLYWGISSAHSVYLELLLGVGVIGALLLIAGIVCAIIRGACRYRATGDIGYGFILALLLYGTMDSITESSFITPSFLTFVAGCGLAHLAFFRERIASSENLTVPDGETAGMTWPASVSPA